MPRTPRAAATPEDLPFEEEIPTSRFTAEEKAEFLADPEVKAELQKVIAEQVAEQVKNTVVVNAAGNPGKVTYEMVGPRHMRETVV